MKSLLIDLSELKGKQIKQKERVQIVKAAGYPGYDKYLDSKAEQPERYGICRTEAAQRAVDAVATAQNGVETKKERKRTGDRHKVKNRISFRPKHEAEFRWALAVLDLTPTEWLRKQERAAIHAANAKKEAPADAANTDKGAYKYRACKAAWKAVVINDTRAG